MVKRAEWQTLVQGTMGLVQSSMRLVQSTPPQKKIWRAPDVSACKPNAGGHHATHLEGPQPVGKVKLIHGWPIKTHLNQEALKFGFQGDEAGGFAEGTGHLMAPG